MSKSKSLGRRAAIVAGGAALLAAGGWFGYVVPKNKPIATLATGYMARVACACHYVGERSIESCAADAEPGMEAVAVRFDAAGKTATAAIPMLAAQTATYSPGLGCVLGRP